MSEILANAAIAISLLLTGVSLVLMMVGLVSYGRLKHAKLLWVSLAFAIMAGQGVWFTLEAYATRTEPTFPGLAVASLAIAVALYAAALKR